MDLQRDKRLVAALGLVQSAYEELNWVKGSEEVVKELENVCAMLNKLMSE